MTLLDDFLIRAALAALGTALAAAPLGCFVVWRRMAYFGDATAHASILGVALALGFSLSVFAGAAVIALLMALAVAVLSGRTVAQDTLLGVLSHGALAVGLVAVALIDTIRVDLNAYLFGDVLAVDRWDLAIIWSGALAVGALLSWRWSALLTSTLSPDLARAAGLHPDRERLVLTLALALFVAVAIKVVGALLIGALLLIPAATARNFAKTPEGMALGAMVLGCVAALGGLQVAFWLDTPAGPTIVATAAALFAVATVLRVFRPV